MTAHISADRDQLAREVAERIALLIRGTLAENEVAHLVLAGGSTFLEAYACLASEYKKKIDWPRVHLYFGDERCVDPEEGRSNYYQVKKSLLENLDSASLPIVHRMEVERGPEEAIKLYAALVPASFDLVLCGLGSDGHTASLFPGSLGTLKPGLLVMSAEAELAPLVPRVTLTPEALNNSRHMLVAASGREKASILHEIAIGTPGLPISLLHPLDGLAEWFLDAEAASQLS